MHPWLVWNPLYQLTGLALTKICLPLSPECCVLPCQAREDLNPTFPFLGLRHLSGFRGGKPSLVTSPLCFQSLLKMAFPWGMVTGVGLGWNKERGREED